MKRVKQTISVFLALLMLITALPLQVSAAKKLDAPTPSAYTSDSNITVRWSKVKNATGYKTVGFLSPVL